MRITRCLAVLLILVCLGCSNLSPEAARLKEINPEGYAEMMKLTVAEMEMQIPIAMRLRDAMSADAPFYESELAKVETCPDKISEAMELPGLVLDVMRQELKKRGK